MGTVTLERLRQKAESMLSQGRAKHMNVTPLEIDELFHDLQVYQLELEMQVEELRNVTQELELQKIKFSNLFEQAPVGYMVINKHGIIMEVNMTTVELLGRDKYMLLKKPLTAFIHTADIEPFYVFLRHLKIIPALQHCILRMNVKGDEFVDVQLSAIMTGIDRKEPHCYLTLTDITENQQSKLNLITAKQRLEVALEASSTGIWEVDMSTGKIFLDEYSHSLFNLRPFDFDGTLDALLKCVHPADRDFLGQKLRSTIINSGEFNLTCRVKTSDDDIRYLQAMGRVTNGPYKNRRFIGTVTDITERRILEEETKQLKEEQQHKIMAAAIQAEEKEKKRISESLHNGIGQMLYGLKLMLDMHKQDLGNEYSKINELAGQTIADVRNISFELAPAMLVDFGLKATLEEMANRLKAQDLNIKTQVTGVTKSDDIDLQLSIYRIIQELVNNGLKHGKATLINIIVVKNSRSISITVTDNGLGFDIEKTNSLRTGNGLSSIRNRLGIYKGSMDIQSKPGKGTKVKINIKQFH